MQLILQLIGSRLYNHESEFETFCSQIVISMYRGGLERGTTVSAAIYKTQWRHCHGLGHFSQWYWEKASGGFIFQHDNDLKNNANAVKAYLGSKTLSVMYWPSQSRDININEALWYHLDRTKQKAETLKKELEPGELLLKST